MGIHGQWEVVNHASTSQHTTLSKEAQKHLAQSGRPLRVVVDASILLWKMITGTNKPIESGINHASKDFMYHVCHDMRAGVQAVYVSDGPGRPSTKRGKVRLRPNPAAKPPPPPTTPEEQYRLEDNLDHVTALAKEVLDHLNIPRHDAPGEAEAECVELEKAKLVDAIVTTDGDTLAFGGQRILRYHSRNMKDGMQMIKADELKKARRDRGTWILLALLSGGDYSDGVPGCKDVYATKILDLAATPGSPVNILCSMLRSNTSIEGHRGMLNGWRTKFLPNFRTSVQAISANVARNIPPDFPNDMIVNLYLHPTVSPSTTIERLALRPLWQRIASAQQLRDFAARAFDWQGQSRAKQFLHALTPGLLAQHLLVSGCRQTDCSNLLHSNKPPKRVTGKASEDVPMARVRYDALKVAAIDYDEDQDLPHVRKWRHGEGDRHDPAMAYETMLPEFLLAFGAPSSAIPGEHQPGNPSKKIKSKPSINSSSSLVADDLQAASTIVRPAGFHRLESESSAPITSIGKGKGRAMEEMADSLAFMHSKEVVSAPKVPQSQRGSPLQKMSANVNSSSGSSLECIDLTDD